MQLCLFFFFFWKSSFFFNSLRSIAIITFTWPSSTTWSPNLTTLFSLWRPNVWLASLLGLVVNSLPVIDEILSMCESSGTCWMVVCQEGFCSSANINRQQKNSPLKKLIIHWFKGLTVKDARSWRLHPRIWELKHCTQERVVWITFPTSKQIPLKPQKRLQHMPGRKNG